MQDLNWCYPCYPFVFEYCRVGPSFPQSYSNAWFVQDNKPLGLHLLWKTCQIFGFVLRSHSTTSALITQAHYRLEGRRHNARSVKCYLAIFVYMEIKAVHIGVVSDLSTPAFIAALHRFIARRSIPFHIYSDCGTNFQGADTVLRTQLRDPVVRELCSTQIPCQWYFNPPAAPHFGGLWEAAVKSTKYHLKRVIGTQLLTFEEMSTLAHRIEALINSRPLVSQSSDHFLIGCPLVALPEPDLTSTPMNRLSRWQLLTQFQPSFWKRWLSEYLTTLQGRSKWYRKQANIVVGDLVIVHNPNTSPTHWKLGRVELTHPGEDGVVRVVTVRTSDGSYKRPVVKLAVLPVEDEQDS